MGGGGHGHHCVKNVYGLAGRLERAWKLARGSLSGSLSLDPVTEGYEVLVQPPRSNRIPRAEPHAAPESGLGSAACPAPSQGRASRELASVPVPEWLAGEGAGTHVAGTPHQPEGISVSVRRGAARVPPMGRSATESVPESGMTRLPRGLGAQDGRAAPHVPGVGWGSGLRVSRELRVVRGGNPVRLVPGQRGPDD